MTLNKRLLSFFFLFFLVSGALGLIEITKPLKNEVKINRLSVKEYAFTIDLGSN
jgi:hypothetical protein